MVKDWYAAKAAQIFSEFAAVLVCTCCSLAVLKCVGVNIWISVICQPLRDQWGLSSDSLTAESLRENSPLTCSSIFAHFCWYFPIFCPSCNFSISRPNPPLAVWAKIVCSVYSDPSGLCRTPDCANYACRPISYFNLSPMCVLIEWDSCLFSTRNTGLSMTYAW